MLSKGSRLSVVSALIVGMFAVAPQPMLAATLTVTDFGDSGAPGQLRTLINQAAPGDTIVIPAGTITLTGASNENANASGDLDINKNLTIQGAGAGLTIIDGGGIDRVFEIFGGTVSISHVTIRNGNPGAGAGVFGGGILNLGGTLTLTNSTVSGNAAGEAAGGIGSIGTLTLINVTVSGNSATDGGGIGIDENATATLTNVTVSGNSATHNGGGVANGGTVTLTNVTVSGNSATNNGGGISNGDASTATLTNVTVSGNSATHNGGGIHIGDNAIATLTNSTISSNTVTLDGGGIRNFGALTLTNATLSANTANQSGGGLANFGSGTASLTNVTLNGNTSPLGGGIASGLSASATLSNTIVANSPSGGNCNATILSQGHNLSSDASCAFAGPGDLNSTDPLLGPLQDNGGPTFTHALLLGSPAIDGGPNPDCPPTDQRGFRRPVDGDSNGTAKCDIGAFELVPVATTVLAGVLPTERTALVGGPDVTAFATALNTGSVLATGCAIAPITPVPATFTYQTTNPDNSLAGTPNTPVDIAGGAAQAFVFAFAPTAPFPPTEVQFSFACTNSAPAPITAGVNTFRLRATTDPSPDPVALAGTLQNDGIVHLASVGVFVVATVNLGAPGLITVTADTGGVALPVTLTLCETDPVTSLCLAPPALAVQTQINSGATPTFGVFVSSDVPIPFDPATNRVQVHLEGGGGGGGTSVAVCTQSLCP